MAYSPRLTALGIKNNPYWYARNPFYQSGYGMPNCTCYAWGRFWEIGDPLTQYIHRPELPRGNGNQWFAQAQTAGIYQTGQTPKLGAVICFGGASPGHVAIVEQIRPNGVIVTSNSAWKSTYFYTSVLTPTAQGKYKIYLSTKTYTSQGFIYNPYSDSTPTPPTPEPTPSGENKFERGFPWPVAWQHWNNFKR